MKQVEVLSKKKELYIHLFFLLFLIYVNFIHLDYSAPYLISFSSFSLFSITANIVFLITFYFHYFVVMPKIIHHFNWKKILVGFAATYGVFVILRYLIEQVITVWIWGAQNYYPGTPVLFYLFDNIYFSAMSIVISTIVFIVIHFIRSLQLNQIFLKEKNEAELRFLKSKINPHFIFNTLNNIYYLVYQKSEQALPAIDKLSKLMRYLTYETNQHNIELQKEIDYINDFIALEKLRIAGKTNINLTFNVEDLALKIPPLLLLPFIENCFKHGIVTDKEHPLIITITQKDNQLELFTQNKINTYQKDTTKGIGLSNIRQRLELQFPNKHSLIIQQDSSIFTSQLTITL